MIDGMTFYHWIRERPQFLLQYERATRDRADAQAEEIIHIHETTMAEITANPQIANAIVSVRKLQSDNLKWAMSKTMPKKYGDKLELDGLPPNPIQYVNEVPSNQQVPPVNKDV